MWIIFQPKKLPQLKAFQFFGKNFSPSTSSIFSLKQKTLRGGEGAVVVKFFAPLLGEGRPQPPRAERFTTNSLF